MAKEYFVEKLDKKGKSLGTDVINALSPTDAEIQYTAKLSKEDLANVYQIEFYQHAHTCIIGE